jgi:hypothetical protein
MHKRLLLQVMQQLLLTHQDALAARCWELIIRTQVGAAA